MGLYHKVRSSEDYTAKWVNFLDESISAAACPIYEYVTDNVFKELIKTHYPINCVESDVGEMSITYEEANALHYAAGYVPRALAKKLRKLAPTPQRAMALSSGPHRRW